MMPCTRGEAPELLAKYRDEIAQIYADKRNKNSSYIFKWPQREGHLLGHVAREALEILTDHHCAYCDGYPIDVTGEAQIDHFRPKSREEFYHLVADWTNLFLACAACNKAKLETWNDFLLKPDEPGYSFERYFEYKSETGKLDPNPVSIEEDQLRARKTIEVMDLNRAGACMCRRRAVERIRKTSQPEELQDLDYRFLIPIVQGPQGNVDLVASSENSLTEFQIDEDQGCSVTENDL